jgi:cytochrome P450
VRTRKASQVFHTYIQSFIDERRQHPKERHDFLSALLQAKDEDGRPMSDEQLMVECLTLFGAGIETTATALTWSCCLLSQHPAIYQKVHEEVDSVLQGRTPTYADLAQLPYGLQVFKEALRLYPPSSFLGRSAQRDVEIDGYLIPKDGLVLISPYTLHRREEYFPEPETFNPDRFNPEREKQLPRYAYVPFGAGPHVCVGQYFAMMAGHLALATLVQRTSFSLVPGQTIVPDPVRRMTTRPAGAVNVVVKKR